MVKSFYLVGYMVGWLIGQTFGGFFMDHSFLWLVNETFCPCIIVIIFRSYSMNEV
jgi:hypothetical protein